MHQWSTKIKNPLAHQMYKRAQSGSFHEPFPMEFPNTRYNWTWKVKSTLMDKSWKYKFYGLFYGLSITQHSCHQHMSPTSTQKTYQHVSQNVIEISMTKLISDKSPDFILFLRMKHQKFWHFLWVITKNCDLNNCWKNDKKWKWSGSRVWIARWLFVVSWLIFKGQG